MKTDFSFKPLTIALIQKFKSPVGATVRKSDPRRVCFRINGDIMKKTGFKAGVAVTPFFDKARRALLFVTAQQPVPYEARKVYGKDSSACFEFPRAGVLAEWFPGGPRQPLILHEASRGRLVIQVPKKPSP